VRPRKKGSHVSVARTALARGEYKRILPRPPPLSLPAAPDLVYTPCHCVPSTGQGVAPDKLSILMSQPAFGFSTFPLFGHCMCRYVLEEPYLEAGSSRSPVSDRRILYHERSNIERFTIPSIKDLCIVARWPVRRQLYGRQVSQCSVSKQCS
jgi:hypothetical protein